MKNLKNINNELYIGKYKLSDLGKEYGTPSYIFDQYDLEDTMSFYKNTFKSNLFNTSVVYASKAFLVPFTVVSLSSLPSFIVSFPLTSSYSILLGSLTHLAYKVLLDNGIDEEAEIYSADYRTRDVRCDYYEPGENAIYINGLESFDNMIYVMNNNKTLELYKLTQWYAARSNIGDKLTLILHKLHRKSAFTKLPCRLLHQIQTVNNKVELRNSPPLLEIISQSLNIVI